MNHIDKLLFQSGYDTINLKLELTSQLGNSLVYDPHMVLNIRCEDKSHLFARASNDILCGIYFYDKKTTYHFDLKGTDYNPMEILSNPLYKTNKDIIEWLLFNQPWNWKKTDVFELLCDRLLEISPKISLINAFDDIFGSDLDQIFPAERK